MTSSHDSLDDAEHITHTHELLIHAALRAQDRPAYVAWALAQVRAREGLSDDVLAARLGLATGDLPRLALCLRPRPDQWDADLAQIASRFGLVPEPLATLLRAVEAPGGPRHDPTG
jgi:DNA-binding phage protein